MITLCNEICCEFCMGMHLHFAFSLSKDFFSAQQVQQQHVCRPQGPGHILLNFEMERSKSNLCSKSCRVCLALYFSFELY